MLGFFEWISDEMIPPRDAYDPAVGRPRCKQCGKDAWLMWNGKYSAYCSTECENSDKRKGLQRSSVHSLLPSRGARKGAKASAFERAVAAKKAARDIKAIAEKWTAQRKKEVKEDIYAGDTQQRDFERSGEDVRKGESFAQLQAEEADFYKKQARLAQVAEALAKEHLRTQEETSFPSFEAPGTVVRPGDAHVSRLNCPSFWSSEAAALEQAFADELKRQAEDEERQRTSERAGKTLARTRNLTRSTQAPLCDFSSSSRYKDTAVQTHLQTPEDSARERDNRHNSHKCERDTENGKVSMGSKHRRDEDDYEGNCHKTSLEATTSTLPRAEYAHPVGLLEQSTTAAKDKTTTSGSRHIPRSKRWRDCTTRELEKTDRGEPAGDSTKKQPPNEEDRLIISLDSKEGGTRLRQQRRDPPGLYRRPPHVPPPEFELPGSVQNESPCAITTKLDVQCPTKSIEHAKKHSSVLSNIPQGDVISAASPQTTLEAFRVAGTSDTYVTLGDMQRLREAAWMETKMAMEEVCACCAHGEYAGNLEVHILSAENVNPARVSPDDRLYVVVRCQVAEKEWAEKQSKSVRNLRWDESLSFPLRYEKYPLRARVCVQLWKRAPHLEDGDLFVGEGEIPFPLNVTRCVLPVQLCWNTKLGGSVVDLDCGRLHVAVRLRQRMHAGAANSTLTQTEAVSANGKGTLNERQQTTTLLEARTALKGSQKLTGRRPKVCNTSGFVKTRSRKPAKYKAVRKNAGDHKSHPSTERGAGKTAQDAADIKWRPVSTQVKSSRANLLGISETNALVSTIVRSIEGDENTVGQGNKQSSVAVEVHRATSGSRSVPQANTAAVTGKRSKYSDAEKDGNQLREEARAIVDTEVVKQGEKQDLIAHAAPTSAKALPLSKSTKSDSEISPETTVTKRTSKFLENLPYSSAAAPASTVSSVVCGVELHQYVSNTIVSFAGKRETISNSRPSFQGPYVDRTLLPSVVPENGITKAELQVLLPVALAQMDDFAHFDAEPGCVAPAANLDPCVLIQPWCTGCKKRTHCANRSCRRIISNRFMNDLFEEEEFRAWGCCSTCQGEMFHTKVSSYTDGSIRLSADNGMYDEFRLESFIPVAFPTLSVIWPSSRHLYVAQRFTQVQIQDRLRQCRTQRELTLTLMAPLLKYFVRSDWSIYRRIALRTCVRLKIQQHPRLQLLLAGTGRALLYDPTLPDFWEWGAEDGAVRTNLVGTLLMELRKEYL